MDLGLLWKVRLNCSPAVWTVLGSERLLTLEHQWWVNGAVITLKWHNCTGSRLSMGCCVLQRWWLVESWQELSEMFKRPSQLIHSIPAGQEKDDETTAVHSWWSCIEYNYFKHSATSSPTRLWLGSSIPRRSDTLNLWLLGTSRHFSLL